MKKFIRSAVNFIFVLLVIVVLLLFNVHVWQKDKENEKEIKALQKEVQIQRQENSKIAAVNNTLREKISSLKKGSMEMIEEEARNDFGMVGEGETFFHLDNEKPAKSD